MRVRSGVSFYCERHKMSMAAVKVMDMTKPPTRLVLHSKYHTRATKFSRDSQLYLIGRETLH